MNEPNEPDLLPCPFCGEEAEIIDHIDDSSITYFVRCCNCNSSNGIYATEESAIKEWNRRAADVPPLPEWKEGKDA